jgi:hypothetical protein
MFCDSSTVWVDGDHANAFNRKMNVLRLGAFRLISVNIVWLSVKSIQSGRD